MTNLLVQKEDQQLNTNERVRINVRRATTFFWILLSVSLDMRKGKGGGSLTDVGASAIITMHTLHSIHKMTSKVTSIWIEKHETTKPLRNERGNIFHFEIKLFALHILWSCPIPVQRSALVQWSTTKDSVFVNPTGVHARICKNFHKSIFQLMLFWRLWASTYGQPWTTEV